MKCRGRNGLPVAAWAIALALVLSFGSGVSGRTPASCPPDKPWCAEFESKPSAEAIGRHIDQLWRWYREGNPQGALRLAEHFEKGDYLPRDLKKAEELYLGLIETGYLYAEPRPPAPFFLIVVSHRKTAEKASRRGNTFDHH